MSQAAFCLQKLPGGGDFVRARLGGKDSPKCSRGNGDFIPVRSGRVRARQYRNSMAPLVVLTGKGVGRPAADLDGNVHCFLFPYCVSAVLSETLSEAELRGLEGCCVRVRYIGTVWLKLVALAGIECLPPARGLTCFFFDTLGLALIFGLLLIRL